MILRTKSFYALAIALLLSPHPVTPASIVVDGADGTDADDGICTLVEAIENANNDAATNVDCAAGSGADDITLTTNVTLTAPAAGPMGSQHGLPLVNSTITIEGGGFSITRGGGSPDFRIMALVYPGDVTLNNVTVSGGRIANPYGRSIGGGIFNNGGILTLNNSTLSGNTAAALGEELAYGGGLYNKGDATFTDSTVSGNSAEVIGVMSGTNQRAAGGGISNCARGCQNMEDPQLVLTSSTVSGNSATVISPSSPTIYAIAAAAGIYGYYGSVTLTNSTLSTNTSYGTDDSMFGPLALGGGITHSYADVYLVNSTLSGNQVLAPDGAIGGAALEYYGFGTGLQTIEIRETILGNHLYGYTCFFIEDSHNLGNNLADDSSCGDGAGAIPNTLTGLSATLADNAGPTQTHALASDSTAIDAAGVCGLATDQRGVLRDDGTCDSGSYEFKPCLAPQGEDFVVPDGVTMAEETFEACNSITVNDRDILGPNGHLILRTAGTVILDNGFECGVDGRLTVEIDSGIVAPELQ